jgi:arylsulfatase A-like enzyme
VRAIDFMPTLLDLCGLAPKSEVQGVSLEPWMRGRRTDDLLAVTETARAGGQRAISDGKTKLIHFQADGRTELYDLTTDPGERLDLAATRLDLRERLADRLQTWAEETEAVRARYWNGAGESEGVEMSPEVIRRLEELGYLG